MAANTARRKDVVKALLDAKAVDFAAVGKVLTELGSSLSLADDPGDVFCGTGPNFFHCFGFPPSAGVTQVSVEQLAALRQAAPELR